jgi:elongator complex protein 6
MPPSSRIPPLLQPCVRLPKNDSLLLVTSTLGASANWLVVRFLYDALKDGGAPGDEGANVVLVSWMREYSFWKQEARKGCGLDLDKLRREGKFAFVDGLSGLFLDARGQDGAAGQVETKTSTAANSGVQASRAPQTLPLRGAPPGRTIPARGPPAPAAGQGAPSGLAAPAPAPATATPASNSPTSGLYTLTSADLAHLKSTVLAAVSHTRPATSSAHRKTLLVLDNPDILLATSPHPAKTLPSLTSLLLTLHTEISHVLVHMQADTPLLTLSTPPQPIEHAQHNFLVKMAHMSRRVLSVRVLDTGVARDVSGVLRVTENRDRLGDLSLEKKNEDEFRGGKEVLYKIGGDGSVKVFERGAGGEL